MANLKKRIIIVFWGVFILIKVSPTYYRDQFLPLLLTGNANSATVSLRIPLPEKFLIRIDKGIIESDAFSTISKIKFSEIPLALTFLATCFLFLGAYKKLHPHNYSFCETRRYLSQRVLRL